MNLLEWELNCFLLQSLKTKTSDLDLIKALKAMKPFQ